MTMLICVLSVATFFLLKTIEYLQQRPHGHKASTMKALYRISFANSCFNAFNALLQQEAENMMVVSSNVQEMCETFLFLSPTKT